MSPSPASTTSAARWRVIIATEAVAKHLTPETQSRYTTNCMIKHLGEPIDIAYMALYLASDESKYVTAHVMNVSGGWM